MSLFDPIIAFQQYIQLQMHSMSVVASSRKYCDEAITSLCTEDIAVELDGYRHVMVEKSMPRPIHILCHTFHLQAFHCVAYDVHNLCGFAVPAICARTTIKGYSPAEAFGMECRGTADLYRRARRSAFIRGIIRNYNAEVVQLSEDCSSSSV